jgi:hypothetical protein
VHARNQTGQCKVLKYCIKAYKNVRQKCEPFVIIILQKSVPWNINKLLSGYPTLYEICPVFSLTVHKPQQTSLKLNPNLITNRFRAYVQQILFLRNKDQISEQFWILKTVLGSRDISDLEWNNMTPACVLVGFKFTNTEPL